MFNDPEKTIKMCDEEFLVLRDFINRECGLYFELSSKYILEKRLSRRIHEHQLSTFKDYHYFLLYDKNRLEEMGCLVDILTTNETYFLREEYQLKAFKEEILPEIVKKKKDKIIRVWSAGCSSGEEPYTLAMLVLEASLPSDWKVEIIGSDISQRVLQIARRGVYSTSSFRVMPDEYKEKFFHQDESGKYHVNDELKDKVTFGKLNLLDSQRINLIPNMDIILCRNVIIYFDNETKRKVIGNFYNKLNGGGYLLLGHSESLMNISTSFKLKHLKNDMVYQKPEEIAILDKPYNGADL
ncbi:MAG: protein-glutamate O-methyltransferase CheR [bacterium]|nr:protein-glutamate O-methyltransferase CheR [bacterium]